MAKERASEDTFFRRAANIRKDREMEKAFEEKRKHKRFKLDNYSVECARKSILTAIGLKKNIAHELFDISGGGARLVVGEHLPLDTRVSVRVDLHQFNDSIETTGKIAWIRNVAPTGAGTKTYQVGVRFDDPESKEAKKIDYMKTWFLSPQAQAKMDMKSKTTGIMKLLGEKPKKTE